MRVANALRPTDVARIAQLAASDFDYSIRNALVRAHVDGLDWALSAWAKGFFCNDYLGFDVPYAGALDLVRELHARGANIVYLSGRDEPLMGEGTRQSLRDCGFPLDVPRVSVVLKPDARLDDVEWKSTVIEEQFSHGSNVLAAFDNEPANCNCFVHHCPHAWVYLVDTGHTAHAPPADPRVIRIDELIAPDNADAASV